MRPRKLGKHTTVAQAEKIIAVEVAADRSSRSIRWAVAAIVFFAGAYRALVELRDGEGWGAAGVFAFALFAFNLLRPHGPSMEKKLEQAERGGW